MIVFEKIAELREHLSEVRKNGKVVGFVPTMGALHDGHLALINRSKSCTDYTVCSIFVNPIQFNNPDDLKKYPRNLEKDSALLEKANCDLVFFPSVEEMYPDEIIDHYDFGQLERVMEGAHRPGHFNGVAIVVKKFLEIIEPDKAFFGEKDFQQLMIVKELVRIEGMKAEIVPCPIIREPDGLAMSSRNARLNDEERKAAPVIYNSLSQISNLKKSNSLDQVKNYIIENINRSGILKVEYIDIANAANLEIIDKWPDKPLHLVACIAVNAGSVRLIDNYQFYS